MSTFNSAVKAVAAAVIGAVACGGLTQTSIAADKVVVGITAPAYSTAIGNVIKAVVEDNLGVKVDFVPGSTSVVFKAMDSGKGDVDIHPAVWLPNSQALVDEYVTKKGTVVLTDAGWKVRQGYCTTKYGADKYAIKSIYDLARPEVVQLTDVNHTGKGIMWIGDASWNSVPVDKAKAKSYGLADLYEFTTSTEEFELVRTSEALKRNQVVLFACDTAHNFFFPKGSVAFLDEPPHDPAKWHPVMPAQDADWYAKSSVSTSWPTATGHIAYSKRLQTEVPDVARVLGKMKFDENTVGEWTNAIAVQKRDGAAVAREWIAAHKEIIVGWLSR
jgi:glycine betaine/proline transport system substrate-binding protein